MAISSSFSSIIFWLRKEAIVLRPISSTNAMTLSPSEIDFEDLKDLVDEIMKNDKIEAVFYDLTGKPPWTVEWE